MTDVFGTTLDQGRCRDQRDGRVVVRPADLAGSAGSVAQVDVRGEQVCREGAAGLVADRSLFNAIANDKRSGSKIAQALVIFGNEDGDGANSVEERNLVNIADEVAGH